jgi:putative CocE/NonD family hydrolase
MRAPTNDVRVERDVPVPMHDGVVLLTDIHHPVGVDGAPTVLERTPYGRGELGGQSGPELARRGYRYIVQACRGTDGSGGTHSYFAEATDGRSTADWIAEQPWFDGRLGSYGASYMGFTQWALASTRPPYLKAMAVALSTSVRSWSWYPGGAPALELIIPWDLGALQFNQPKAEAVVTDISPEAIAARMAQLQAAFAHLPLGEVMLRFGGRDLELYQEQLAHVDDDFWQPLNFRAALREWTVPTLLVDGWHDYPLPGVCDDYAVLRDAGVPVRLRIGAGGHLGGGGEGGMTDAPLAWFDTYLLERPDLAGEQWEQQSVSVHVQGSAPRWRDLADWPPPGAVATAWYLHDDGALSTEPPSATGPAADRYRYDPADPTPAHGGIGLLTGGMVDNRALEARDDVLVYTSGPLAEPLELIGTVQAELHVESTLDHTDLFVRLCDVHPDGRSLNICDGLTRCTPGTIRRDAAGVFRVDVPLWPVGHRLEAGHRLRVQVSSGAHPVYGRNLGTGEPHATATQMRVADQTVHRSARRASRIVLPHHPA